MCRLILLKLPIPISSEILNEFLLTLDIIFMHKCVMAASNPTGKGFAAVTPNFGAQIVVLVKSKSKIS